MLAEALDPARHGPLGLAPVAAVLREQDSSRPAEQRSAQRQKVPPPGVQEREDRYVLRRT